MIWFSVKKLESEDLIREYEIKIDYNFPSDFIECVKENNGGCPEFENFNTRNNVEVFNRLHSFNKSDRTNIWREFDWTGYEEMKSVYVIFACDPFGNKICFDKRDDSIIFLNHETMEVEKIADSFSDLINNKLYKYEQQNK